MGGLWMAFRIIKTARGPHPLAQHFSAKPFLLALTHLRRLKKLIMYRRERLT
jgi:hypothetical protein